MVRSSIQNGINLLTEELAVRAMKEDEDVDLDQESFYDQVILETQTQRSRLKVHSEKAPAPHTYTAEKATQLDMGFAQEPKNEISEGRPAHQERLCEKVLTAEELKRLGIHQRHSRKAKHQVPLEEYKAFVMERCAKLEAEAQSVPNQKDKKCRYLRRLSFAFKNRLKNRLAGVDMERDCRQMDQLIPGLLGVVQ